METDNLLSVVAAASLLGITRGAVYQAVQAKRIKVVKVAGHICISKEEVERLQKQRTPESGVPLPTQEEGE